jgi:hypothetical protein
MKLDDHAAGALPPSRAAKVKVAGVAQNLGELQASDRDFQSKIWATF